MMGYRRLRSFLKTPLLALALIAVLVDDAFRALVVPAVRALARLRLIRRIEERIAALPPRGILLLFVIPLAVIEPFKIYALYLIGQGRFLAAVLTFVAAKVVGLGLAERLFSIGRDKLLSIPWFAWCHARIVFIGNLVHGWLAGSPIWRQALRLLLAVRGGLATVRTRLGLLVRRGTGERLAEARRRLRRHGAA